MIFGKTVLALIPARGGSKGVPRKNIKELGGKPLLAWTIEAAQQSAYIDRLILSSDDQEIIETALRWGCESPFARPGELATDDASTMDAVRHALCNIEERYDYVVLLQPTSPFRSGKDIDQCLEFCLKRNAPACVSVTECRKSPYWMYFVEDNGLMNPVVAIDKRPERRQDLHAAFELNGAIYVARTEWIASQPSFVRAETVAYVMPRERSLDIDSEKDFHLAKFLIERDVYHESSSSKICRLHQGRK